MAWSMVILLLTAVVITFANMAYTSHVQRVADQRWCNLLANLDQPQMTQPTTPRAQAIQQQIRQLRADMRCPG